MPSIYLIFSYQEHCLSIIHKWVNKVPHLKTPVSMKKEYVTDKVQQIEPPHMAVRL